MWKEFKFWLSETLKDERQRYSSKRFIGIIAGLSLCAALIVNSFFDESVKPSDVLVYAVAMLSFGALGLASIDKIWGKTPFSRPNRPTRPSYGHHDHNYSDDEEIEDDEPDYGPEPDSDYDTDKDPKKR